MQYTKEDLVEAKRQIDSTLHKLRETIKTFESKDNLKRWNHWDMVFRTVAKYCSRALCSALYRFESK